jgi:protein tyrosine phosphatase (PTP) superfamily phosphohydrolase (DUF442 family)
MADHPPGEGFAIIFTDKTGQERTEESIALLVKRLQEAAEIHGFKWCQHGTRSQVRKSLADEQRSIDDRDLAEMLAEYRRQRAEREDADA